MIKTILIVMSLNGGQTMGFSADFDDQLACEEAKKVIGQNRIGGTSIAYGNLIVFCAPKASGGVTPSR